MSLTVQSCSAHLMYDGCMWVTELYTPTGYPEKDAIGVALILPKHCSENVDVINNHVITYMESQSDNYHPFYIDYFTFEEWTEDYCYWLHTTSPFRFDDMAGFILQLKDSFYGTYYKDNEVPYVVKWYWINKKNDFELNAVENWEVEEHDLI